MPTRQAGDRLGKSQRQVRAMIRRGELSGHKFANLLILNRAEVEAKAVTRQASGAPPAVTGSHLGAQARHSEARRGGVSRAL